MGSVYRAEDSTLHRPVALKFLIDRLTFKDSMRARFLREARLIASLNHSNICTLFDYGEVRPGEEDSLGDGAQLAVGTPYLAMELVEGQTLASVLSAGPLPLDRWLRFARELTAGLAEAHARGIIHRDLKPTNVMLTADGVIKILDFGLAKSVLVSDDPTAETLTADLTVAGQVLGTIAYMSPEQARGERADARSDVFGLGIILYEMAAGERPFVGSSPMSVMAKIMEAEPPPLPANVPGPMRDLVARCLSKDPEERYPDADHVQSDLDQLERELESATVLDAPPAVTRPSRTGLWTWLAVVVAVALVAGIFWATRGLRGTNADPSSSSTEEVAVAVPVRRSVAVLDFKAGTAGHSSTAIGTGIAEILSAELTDDLEIRAVDRELVTSRASGRDLRLLGQSLAADYLASGTYYLEGQDDGLVRIQIELLDVATGEILAEGGTVGARAELWQVVSRAARPIRQALGLPGATPEQGIILKASFPRGSAAEFYFEGLDKLRRFEPAIARDLFGQAIQADDEHPLPYWGLARAQSILGNTQDDYLNAERAAELAAGLSQATRLMLRAYASDLAYDYETAIEDYQTLAQLFPDDTRYAFALAEVQLKDERKAESFLTLEALRALPEPLSSDPRIDLGQADAALEDGRYEDALNLATSAVAKGEQLDSGLTVAWARLRSAGPRRR